MRLSLFCLSVMAFVNSNGANESVRINNNTSHPLGIGYVIPERSRADIQITNKVPVGDPFMKIIVDNEPLFEVTDLQKRVMCNDIQGDLLYEDLKRRLKWVIEHQYQQCFIRLKQEWDVKFKASGIKVVPTDEEEYAQLVFAQPNYQDRAARKKRR